MRLDFSRQHVDADAVDVPPLELDRQRILHSTAFRRLQYKTQVFVAPESDHFRTRLTHTLEVAHVARRLAGMLGCNADLAETVALAHDLGHPPFGHAGERQLNECLRDCGGFEHNDQSLRVVEYLEHPYPAFRGLNLTRAVRACLARHQTLYDRPSHDARPEQQREAAPLESSVADWGDQIAYCLHDLQDGIFAEFIRLSELTRISLWTGCYHGPDGETPHWRGHVRPALDRILQLLLTDLVQMNRAEPQAALRLSATRQQQLDELAAFLARSVYQHHRVLRSDAKARRVIAAIFDAYCRQPQLLPPRYLSRVDQQGLPRVAADYIAGMTDRFCADEHARLFDPGTPF